MPTFKLDPLTHDIAVENNELVLISGADETAQRLRCRLRMFQGEWFLDVTRGVPYRQEIFVKGIALERIAAAFKREILTTPGVAQLLSYDQAFDGAQRRLTVTFSVLSTTGEIVDIAEVI